MTEYQGAGLRHHSASGGRWFPAMAGQRSYTDPAYIAEGPKACVCNISDQEFVRGLGSLGTYTIPAARPGHITIMSGEGLKFEPCAAGEEYALLEVEPRIEKVDIGMGLESPPKWGREHWPARKIAESVALLDSTENLEKFGIFVCAGERPTAAELERGRASLTAFYQKLVFEADQLYARPNGSRDITDVHRRAAKFLKQERPWSYTPAQMQTCPGCGASVMPGIAIHPACGAILDGAKAMELGIVKPSGKTLSGDPGSVSLDADHERQGVKDTPPATGHRPRATNARSVK